MSDHPTCPICAEPMRFHYICNDPENGPAEWHCKTHGRLEEMETTYVLRFDTYAASGAMLPVRGTYTLRDVTIAQAKRIAERLSCRLVLGKADRHFASVAVYRGEVSPRTFETAIETFRD
jgi:hypothetical protein